MNLFLSFDIMYEALLNKDPQFEGQFVVGVKTTGIFCRSTCTARKPKKESVEFFETTKEALTNGYRPCKICKPLEKLGEVPKEIKVLISEIEANPTVKIKDYDLVKREIDPNRVRRWFLKHHGMTFHAYQRFIRINNAFRNIKNGDKVIEAAYDTGFESLSGFQYSFKKATSLNPRDSKNHNRLTMSRITTPLGPMLTIACEEGICMLDFADRKMIETEIKQLQNHYKSNIIPGNSEHFNELEKQVGEYFAGTRQVFSIPLATPGSDFQNRVWKLLQSIPFGETRSYKEQAIALGDENAVRAVAKANGNNRISILIPCHRVIGNNGQLTGYGGGLWRKKWLLEHEQKCLKN